MSRTKLLAIAAAVGLATTAGGLFTAAAVAISSSMQPRPTPIAEICPCIAHVRCTDTSVAAGQHGWYFTPDQPNGGAILMLPGIGANRQDMLGLGNVFLRRGYSILAVDLRGSGQSEGQITYAALESRDVARWSEWLLRQPRVTRLYGFGVSLGGTSLLESLDLEHRFRAVVAESAFSDFRSIAVERMARVIPPGLRWIAGPFVYCGMLWARLRYGVNLFTPSAVESLRRSQTPALIIHGLADGATLPEHSRRIAAASPRAELWLIPRAAHANAWATAGKEFEDRVLSWYGAH